MTKSSSYKISKKTILSCMVIGAVAISNCSAVKAIDTSSIMTTAISSNKTDINGEHKFIIDAPLKVYDDINKAENAAGFKFKVPDFIPDGNRLETFHVRKVTDNDNVVEIFYPGADQPPFDITFQVSKKDHIEALKKIETEKMKTTKKPIVETKQEAMKLGEINGTSLTLSVTSPSEKLLNGDSTKEFTEVFKYFIWENDGLSYSIRYNSIIKEGDKSSKDNLNLPEDTIKKIAESIKYPEDTKSVNYSVPKRELSTEEAVMEIYDKDDLENAKKLLGFSPKLPLKIDDNIIIDGSGVGISDDSDIKDNKINYELISFYSNKLGSITFEEGRTSKRYDDINNNGYFNINIGKGKEPLQVKAEKLNIANKDVFKYEENGFELGQKPEVSYLWKEDGIYYSVTFFNETENSDEIVKGFVESKYID